MDKIRNELDNLMLKGHEVEVLVDLIDEKMCQRQDTKNQDIQHTLTLTLLDKVKLLNELIQSLTDYAYKEVK